MQSPVRTKAIALTITGVLALTTGVALAETSPADPEVLVPVDETTTTTTVDEPTTSTTETTVAPPETTTTTTAAPDEPVVEPAPEPEEDVVGGEAPEVEAPEVHPENHGRYVSEAAHDHGSDGEGTHGAAVSAVARSDAGKRHGGGGVPEE